MLRIQNFTQPNLREGLTMNIPIDMSTNVVFQHQPYLAIRAEFEYLLTAPDAYKPLSANPAAIQIIEQKLERTDYPHLLINPCAIHLIGNYFSMADLKYLSQNPSIVEHSTFDLSHVEWYGFSSNPAAIQYIEENMDKVNIYGLVRNPAAMHLIMPLYMSDSTDCIDIGELSANPNIQAIQIVKNRLDEADWKNLSANAGATELIRSNMDKVIMPSLATNPAALDLIQDNLDKMNPSQLLMNPSIMTYDYTKIKCDQARILDAIAKHTN